MLSRAFYDAFMFVIVDNIMSLFVDLLEPAEKVLVDIHNLLSIRPKTPLFVLRVVVAS